MITNGITERKKTELTDALHLECVQHLQFAKERCKLFRGRNEILQEVQEKAEKSRYGWRNDTYVSTPSPQFDLGNKSVNSSDKIYIKILITFFFLQSSNCSLWRTRKW